METEDIGVFIGVDVGKSEHWATALDRDGRKIYDRALGSAGPSRIAALLKEHGCRRHSAWAQQVCDALEKQTVVVAGTDAAGAVLPHLARQLISLHAQRAEHRDRARGPGGWPTLSCPVLTTRARHQGSRPPQCS